ncbi:MAG TPA: hypothetical protein P5287_03620, partial [bacterium]|nr:hypothetical protein [bacterium]
MARARGKVTIGELIDRVERISQGGCAAPVAPRNAAASQQQPSPVLAGGKPVVKAEKPAAEPHRKAADKVSLAPDQDLMRIHDAWADIILEFGKEQPVLRTFLAEGKIMGYEDGTLVVGFTKENIFHKEALSDKANLALVQKCLSAKVGRDVRLHLDLIDDDAKKEPGRHGGRDAQHKAPEPVIKPGEVHDHPHVKEVLDIFEGKVVRVKK